MGWSLEPGVVEVVNLSHVGVAVRDAEATVNLLSKTWRIGTPESSDYYPKSEDMIFGEAFAVKLTFVRFGPHTYELLQPLDDKSIWSKFIAEHGEGIHHVAYGVSNYDQMVEIMQAQGHKLLVAAVFEGCRWCYFEMQPGGIVIEYREEYPRN